MRLEWALPEGIQPGLPLWPHMKSLSIGVKMIRHISEKCRNCLVVQLMGESYQETLANTETIIQEWIETAKSLGRPTPEPKGRLAYA